MAEFAKSRPRKVATAQPCGKSPAFRGFYTARRGAGRRAAFTHEVADPVTGAPHAGRSKPGYAGLYEDGTHGRRRGTLRGRLDPVGKRLPATGGGGKVDAQKTQYSGDGLSRCDEG